MFNVVLQAQYDIPEYIFLAFDFVPFELQRAKNLKSIWIRSIECNQNIT